MQPGRDGRRGAYRTAAVAVLGALAIAGSVAAAAVDHGHGGQYSDEVATAVVIGIAAVIGAVITLAGPANLLGWLVLGGAAISGVAEPLTEAGVHTIATNGAAPYLVTFGVTARTLGALVGYAAVPAYYPDGALPGPRWHWLKWTLLAAVAVNVAGGLVAPIETRLGEQWHGPFTPDGSLGDNLQALDIFGTLLIAVAGLGALAGLVSRWRRGGPIVRQQLLLFACAAIVTVLFLVGTLIWVIAVAGSGPPRWLFGFAAMPVPFAVAVATLNHGLYDLRRAANRTILLVLMTVSTVAVYVVVVLAAAALSPDRRDWWPPAIAAAVAALVLVPLRDRMQRLVRRVVYGRWHEPYEVLTGLAAQLAAAADVDKLLDAAVAELARELDLRAISVRDLDGTVLAGTPERATQSTPLLAYGVVVGELGYELPGRQLAESEQRLVHDLARQLGATVHARALAHDLQHAREKLVVAREEERRRLRRDLHDGIGPALAGLTLKTETARTLLPEGADTAAAQLHELSDEIRATVVDVRRIVEGLRPPALDELGLEGACRQAVDRLTRAAGVTPDVQVTGDLNGLPAAVEVAAFRIVLEAVTNVIKHAAARQCCVSLTVGDGELGVEVTDDGTGLLDTAGTGNGLATMRERAEELGGSLTVTATRRGVQVTARLPTRPLVAGRQAP